MPERRIPCVYWESRRDLSRSWAICSRRFSQCCSCCSFSGAVLGHNFPFYLKFKGGKGIACTSGMILAVCPLAAPICLALFIGSIAITRYVSLGSILVVVSYLVQVIVFGQLGYLRIDAALLPEFYIVSACFTAMALWRHRSNIKRLLSGTENKFALKKK